MTGIPSSRCARVNMAFRGRTLAPEVNIKKHSRTSAVFVAVAVLWYPKRQSALDDQNAQEQIRRMRTNEKRFFLNRAPSLLTAGAKLRRWA
jgi:hypothetical protein